MNWRRVLLYTWAVLSAGWLVLVSVGFYGDVWFGHVMDLRLIEFCKGVSAPNGQEDEPQQFVFDHGKAIPVPARLEHYCWNKEEGPPVVWKKRTEPKPIAKPALRFARSALINPIPAILLAIGIGLAVDKSRRRRLAT